MYQLFLDDKKRFLKKYKSESIFDAYYGGVNDKKYEEKKVNLQEVKKERFEYIIDMENLRGYKFNLESTLDDELFVFKSFTLIYNKISDIEMSESDDDDDVMTIKVMCDINCDIIESCNRILLGENEQTILQKNNIDNYIFFYYIFDKLKLDLHKLVLLRRIKMIVDFSVLFKMFEKSVKVFETGKGKKPIEHPFNEHLLNIFKNNRFLISNDKRWKKELQRILCEMNLTEYFKSKYYTQPILENFTRVHRIPSNVGPSFKMLFSHMVQKLYESKEKSYNIIIEGNDGKRFKAHIEILVYFLDYFFLCVKFGGNEIEGNKIKMIKLCSKEIELLLQYVYQKKVVVNDIKSGLNLLIEIAAYRDKKFEEALFNGILERSKFLMRNGLFLKEFENFAYLFHHDSFRFGTGIKKEHREKFFKTWDIREDLLISFISFSYFRKEMKVEITKLHQEVKCLKDKNESLDEKLSYKNEKKDGNNKLLKEIEQIKMENKHLKEEMMNMREENKRNFDDQMKLFNMKLNDITASYASSQQNVDNAKHSCNQCGGLFPLSNLSRCGKCKKSLYCSVKCQRIDWKRHKKNCF